MHRIPGGYVDLQINGGWGRHFSDDPGSIWEVGSRLIEHGVTQFLPTLVSDGFGRRAEAAAVLRAGPPPGWVGAEPLGLHLEGPWLTPDRAGAHDRSALCGPDLEAIADFELVRLVTLAPEIGGALAAIAALRARGVVVSLGHSNATMQEAVDGFEAGATMGTHLFNAMSGLGHRAPGLAAALLLDERATFGIIADGHHVDPAMVQLAWRVAGERMVLVSDAVSLMGRTDESAARLANGTLAGATIGLDNCVQNLMAFTGTDVFEAASTASNRPRQVLGIASPNDTWVDVDDDGVVRRTVMAGNVVFER